MALDHDSSYKLLFSHGRLMRDLLMDFVPVARPQALDLASLQRVNGSYVAGSGTARHNDIVWKVRLADEWLYIYLLLEFQSTSDVWMALRMQVYVGLLHQDLVRRKELAPNGKLPPVLPLVLYNGQSRWNAATDLSDLLAPVPQNLRPFQPVQRYWLIDEGVHAIEGSNKTGNLVATLFRLEHWRARDDPMPLITRLIEQLSSPEDSDLRRDFASFLSWLLRRKARDPKIPDMTDLKEVETMLAQRRLDWWEEWMEEGREKGLIEGREKGRLEGETELLRRQLVRRFGVVPAEAEAKLAGATETELIRWSERILEARSLDQLFD